MESPLATPDIATEAHVDLEEPVGVILYNDDVNTFEYVTFVLKRVLKVTSVVAEALMLTVHTTGSAELKRCARNEAEALVMELSRYSLLAQVEG